MLWIMEQVEQADSAAVLARLDSLSPLRQARVRAMRNEEARVCSVLAELLLRCALETEFALKALPRQEAGKKGKPFFPDFPTLCFNLSHCKTTVACGLDTASLGVDAQEPRPLRQKGAGRTAPPLFRVLSRTEQDWVLAVESETEQDRRFASLWTCKEAYGKATGDGILYALDQTAFLPRPMPWEQYGFCFQQLELPTAFVTLCASSPLAVRFVSPSDFLD